MMKKAWADELISLSEDLLRIGELPLAALVVLDGVVVVASTSPAEPRRSRLDHAELVALLKLPAAVRGGTVQLLATAEPCAMCFAAAKIAGIERIGYWLEAADDGVSTTAPELLTHGPALEREGGMPALARELLLEYDRLGNRRSDYAGALLRWNDSDAEAVEA